MRQRFVRCILVVTQKGKMPYGIIIIIGTRLLILIDADNNACEAGFNRSPKIRIEYHSSHERKAKK